MKEPFCGARTYLNAMMISEILIAIAIMLVTAIYYSILASYLVSKDRKILFGQLFNFYIIGFQIIVLFMASLILWRRLWCLPSTRDVHMFVYLWLTICFVIVICGFGTIWSVSACVNELEAAAETAMLNGIDAYYICPDWKLLWDELQYIKQCCGVNSYTDWMDAFWMTEIADINCKSGTSTTYAPYACCRRDRDNCYENYSPNAENVGSLNISLINTAGCLPLYTQNLWRLIYIVLGLLMVAVKLQTFICLLVRFILKRQCGDFGGGRLNVNYSAEALGMRMKSSTSCIDRDLEAQGALEVCSCGNIMTRDDPPEIDDCRNCRSVSAQCSIEDKLCMCNESEIIH